MREKDPLTLFEMEDLFWWKKYWVGMPAFVQENLTPWNSVTVHFANRSDMNAFADLVEQKITDRTKSLWYPPAEVTHFVGVLRYIDEANADLIVDVPKNTRLPKKDAAPRYDPEMSVREYDPEADGDAFCCGCGGEIESTPRGLCRSCWRSLHPTHRETYTQAGAEV